MNPYLHPYLTVLWIAAFLTKAILLARIFPNGKLPKFLYAFVAWEVLWTGGLLFSAFMVWNTPYFVTYWSGLYLSNLFAAAMLTHTACRMFKAKFKLPWQAYAVIPFLLNTTLVFILMRHDQSGELEMWGHGLQLWILGSAIMVSIAGDRVGASRIDRQIVDGLMILFGVGWILAGVLLLLPHHLTPPREVMWAAGMITDIAVFGWWATKSWAASEKLPANLTVLPEPGSSRQPEKDTA